MWHLRLFCSLRDVGELVVNKADMGSKFILTGYPAKGHINLRDV